MAQGAPTIENEDVPLDEARRMSREPRMDPEIYSAHKRKLQSLENTASRLPLPQGTRPTTMKSRMLRVAAELGIPVTIRRAPRGLLFWRSTAEDLHQAQEVVARLQFARQPPQAAQRGRRRTSRSA